MTTEHAAWVYTALGVEVGAGHVRKFFETGFDFFASFDEWQDAVAAIQNCALDLLTEYEERPELHDVPLNERANAERELLEDEWDWYLRIEAAAETLLASRFQECAKRDAVRVVRLPIQRIPPGRDALEAVRRLTSEMPIFHGEVVKTWTDAKGRERQEILWTHAPIEVELNEQAPVLVTCALRRASEIGE